MSPRCPRFAVLPFGLVAIACSAAAADQPVAGPALPSARIALAIAPAALRAPYNVQVIRDNGEPLPTYGQNGRFYVQGNANERYLIRITNPTDRRVEAVVSVDGLDVIDGENGDLRKRGYIVSPHGETQIEGFRTSQADVATFRFSSVAGSYAGRKGKARNVGVIAVAVFEEQAEAPEPQIIGEAAPLPPPRRIYYLSEGASADAAGSSPARAKASAAPAPAARAMPPASADYAPASKNASAELDAAPPTEASRERLGLGTEFGEQRTSAVSYTQFVRAAGRPIAIAELRYNDTAGLLALGIQVHPLPDAGELMTRETADPFPGDHYAQPPR